MALTGSMALLCHHNNLLPAAGGHRARLQPWARGQAVLGLSCLTQGTEAAHQFSLLMWSPKPGVSMTVSFMRTPFSSISAREESCCVRQVLMGALAKPTLPKSPAGLEFALPGEKCTLTAPQRHKSALQRDPAWNATPTATSLVHSNTINSMQMNK